MRAFVFTSARLTVYLLAAAMVLCAQDKPAETQVPQSEAVRPQPSRAESVKAEAATNVTPAPVDPRTYILGSEDVVQIKVWREPDLSELVAVRPDGMITMPLIGDVKAASLTPEQLSKSITEKLTKFINKPDVIVTVTQVRSKRFYITGEVNKPGSFSLVVPTTVLQALTEAGGFRDFANTKKITILRGDKQFKFNYRDVVKGKNMHQNILLEAGDYIIVP